MTFTRAAKDELKDKIRANYELSTLQSYITINTLNSFGNKYIKDTIKNMSLITDSSDKYRLMHNILRPVWLKYEAFKEIFEDSKRRIKAGQDLFELIDLMKTLGFRHDRVITYEEYFSHREFLISSGLSIHLEKITSTLEDLHVIDRSKSSVKQVYEKFIPFWVDCCELMFDSAMFTLEDQKYWSKYLIEKQILDGKYSIGSSRYHYILVDEFQDINPLDMQLLKAIASSNRAKLTIVGDDDQAIYEWRGATPEFILDPDKYIGERYLTCILETNYRSPKNIVEMSQKLIGCNQRRVKKNVKAIKNENASIEVLTYKNVAVSINETSELVCRILNSKQRESIALIGRKRSQIIPYQIIFASKNIPFYAAEDLHILLSTAFQEMKEIVAIRNRAEAFKSGGLFSYDPVKDFLQLCDKVNKYPIRKVDRDNLRRFLYQNSIKNIHDAAIVIGKFDGNIANRDKTIASFQKATLRLMKARTVSDSIRVLSEDFAGLKKDYGKAVEDIFYTDPPFLYLAEFAQKYGDDYKGFYLDIEKAISTLVKVPPEDEEVENEKSEEYRPLHLMTSLRAKGKEFDTVIVLDVNDGIWPSKLAKSDSDFEQERRLFYVAITRPRKDLYLVINETINGEPMVPSQYIMEMGLSIPRK